MSIERELLLVALGYLSTVGWGEEDRFAIVKLAENIRELLAQPEQEPEFNFDLERMKAAIESPILDVTVDDLAKQVKQEPVAWIIETEIYGKLSEWVCTDKKHYMEAHDSIKEPIPLYTAPPKRELLGDGITADMYRANNKATHPDSYWAGVNDAEKAHGIGGGNE